jgi:Polysaccharide lyase
VPAVPKWFSTSLVVALGAGVAAPAAHAGLLFDADFGARGLGAYVYVVHGKRVRIVDDPILGPQRKVARITVYDRDVGPTSNPRVQLETPRLWKRGAAHYVGVSYLFPRSWPDIPTTTGWVGIGSVYGPPWRGSGPNSLAIRRLEDGRQVIQWNPSRRGPTFSVPLVRGRWMDFVMHIRLSRSPRRGFWEMWVDTGGGWRQLSAHGHTRVHAATVDRANAGGPNYDKVSQYRPKGMWRVATDYVGCHRIADTFAEAAPHSYG